MKMGRKFDSITNDEIKRFLNMEFNLNKDISDKDIINYGDENRCKSLYDGRISRYIS